MYTFQGLLVHSSELQYLHSSLGRDVLISGTKPSLERNFCGKRFKKVSFCDRSLYVYNASDRI